jgi:transposase-like protein
VGRGTRGSGRRGDASTNANLERLRQRFAQFRREHPPQTRIPVPLREAVLTAMERGVTSSQVRRACGISSSQLEQWQKRRETRGRQPAERRRPKARVFSVVGEAAGTKPADSHAAPELELRLAGWSIRVRAVGA